MKQNIFSENRCCNAALNAYNSFKLSIRSFFPTLLLSFISFLVSAQDLHKTYSFAEKQFKEKEYSEAIINFQRVLFFDNGSYRAVACRRLAKCYTSLEDYKSANRYFDLAWQAEKNDSIKNEILFEKIAVLLIDRQFSYAMMDLLSITDATSNYFIAKQNFYLGISHFGLNNYKASSECFLKSVDSSELQTRRDITILFERLNHIRCPNPKVAKYLSLIMPGTGQFYSGDFRSGINSLLLTGVLALFGTVVAINYSPLDAFIAVLPWFQRYYLGGSRGAATAATNKRNAKVNLIYSDIIAILAETKARYTN